MEENAIDGAEDYSRSADAEGKGENGDSGEPRTFPQDPQAVTNILDERFDEAHPARIAMFFFKLFHSAEFRPRAASASAGVRPDCASFETCFSKWKRSSSSISASTLFRRNRERKRDSRSFHTSLSKVKLPPSQVPRPERHLFVA